MAQRSFLLCTATRLSDYSVDMSHEHGEDKSSGV